MGETTTGRVPDPFVSPLSWPLASVSARIFGTKVTVNIGRPFPADSSSYTVLLDGERAGTIPAGSLTLELPLKPDTHIISVVKSNEAMYGEALFNAFDIESGQVESYIGPTRKIEIIGDSISTGYWKSWSECVLCSFCVQRRQHFDIWIARGNEFECPNKSDCV